MKNSEHQEQKALFEWAELQGNITPELKLMFAIPNGGHRHKATAGKLKAEGVKAGVPDICLPVARNGYYGMWIELKAEKNTPTKKQTEWLGWLQDQGFWAIWCTGFEEAKNEIELYLGIGN